MSGSGLHQYWLSVSPEYTNILIVVEPLVILTSCSRIISKSKRLIENKVIMDPQANKAVVRVEI